MGTIFKNVGSNGICLVDCGPILTFTSNVEKEYFPNTEKIHDI